MVCMSNQKVGSMAKREIFNPSRQVTAFRRLSDKEFITELDFKKGWKGDYRWNFRMNEVTFLFNNRNLDLDFRSYQLKVIYTNQIPPKIFVTNPVLPKETKHLYKDKSLCLYKPTNWQWQNDMQFDIDLFPNICTWLYHYEVWCDTGNWLGEEAVHDPPPKLFHNLLNILKNGSTRHLPLPHQTRQ